MDNLQEKAIAVRIKEMRELSDLTAAQVAALIGMNEVDYLRHENGEVDLPIGFLTSVAPVLGMDVTELLTGKKPTLSQYCLVRSGKGADAKRREEYRYQNLAYNFQGKSVEPFLVTVDPDDPDVPAILNTHEGQEFDYIVEGILKIDMNGKELILYEGDSIFFDASAPHGMKAIGSTPARFIAVVIPPKG